MNVFLWNDFFLLTPMFCLLGDLASGPAVTLSASGAGMEFKSILN